MSYGSKHDSKRSCHWLRKHQDSVLCCSIDKKCQMIVSGGVDDTAFVWINETKEAKFECDDHKESVVCCGFNLDSSLVATADMSGLVQIRDTNTGELVCTYDIDEVIWLVWHNISSKVLLAGTKAGEFWMWHVTDSTSCKVFPSFHTPTTNGRLLNNGTEILVSYADGSLRTFNLKTQEMIKCFKDNDHNPEIVCLDLSADDRFIALGCIDSKVKIISRSAFKLIKVLTCATPLDEKKLIIDRENRIIEQRKARKAAEAENGQAQGDEEPIEDEDYDKLEDLAEALEIEDEFSANPDQNISTDDMDQDQEGEDYDDDVDDYEEDDYENDDRPCQIEDLSEAVEAVCFSKESDYIVASNTCGSTYLWQVTNQNERAHVHLDAGVSRALWTNKNQCLLGCLDGTVRIFDVNLKCLEIVHLHKEQILDLYYHDDIVVTASDDKTVGIFSCN